MPPCCAGAKVRRSSPVPARLVVVLRPGGCSTSSDAEGNQACNRFRLLLKVPLTLDIFAGGMWPETENASNHYLDHAGL